MCISNNKQNKQTTNNVIFGEVSAATKPAGGLAPNDRGSQPKKHAVGGVLAHLSITGRARGVTWGHVNDVQSP